MGKWRDLAAQVAPPITEKEIITMIVDTLPVFYYGNGGLRTFKAFVDLVFASERIDVGLKRGKFSHPAWTNEKTGANEEGEDEVEAHAVTAIPIQPTQSKNANQEMNFAARKPVEFTPIPVSYADLLPCLLDNSMVAITPTKVHQPPFLREYDSNATCACHEESLGHSIEHCRALKRKVQDLIDMGRLKFEENRVSILTLTRDATHGAILKAVFPERFAKDRIRFPTSRVQSCWMTGPLDGPTFCFLIKVDPWVLVPIFFRGLHVLAIRGLHVLAFRGPHALAFRGLHVFNFRGLEVLVVKGSCTFTFVGLHALTFRGLHVLAFRGLHVLAIRDYMSPIFKGRHALTFRGLHVLAIIGLHSLAFKRRHVLNFRGLHTLAFRGPHVLIFSVLHTHTLEEYKFPGHPLILEGDQLCEHIQRGRLSRVYYAYRGKISPVSLQKDDNILPGDHNANLPLQMYRLVWIAPTRRPVGPKKSNRALGFLALVTGLCQSYRVLVPPVRSCHRDIGIAPAGHPVDPKKSNRVLELSSSNYGSLSVLRSTCHLQQGHQAPTNQAFIKKYCVPRQA
ncbi:hypothetical protein HKD37_07G019546 [Glycine soja]